MAEIREHWGSKLGFMLAAIGSTIGLGLLWKFPYVIGQNGGGIFLFTYFLCLLLIGVPLFIAEVLLGRSSQRAALGAFSTYAKGRGNWLIGGYLGIIASFVIMSFYSVIAGWGMSYVLMSLNGFYAGKSLEQVGAVFETLSHSGTITLFWHFMFTAITMLIVVSGVRQGIEYWSKIMVKILLVLLVGLFLYGTTLSGFSKALHFVFYPDFNSFKFSSMLEALGLAFLTLSLGQGIMISYGSYLKKNENILKMAAVIVASVMCVAILAALTIFPVVFTFDLSPSSGPGLVFKTLPYLFAQLPGSMVLSTLFFTLFVFTALTSAVPLIEVVATNIMEKYKIERKKAVIWVSVCTFICGIPSALAYSTDLFPQWQLIFRVNFLDTLNDLVSNWVIPFAGLVTSIFVGWVMEKSVMKEAFTQGGDYSLLYRPWRFFMRWVIPAVIILIVVQKSGIFSIG